MNNNERIAVLQTMAATFEAIRLLLPAELSFRIEKWDGIISITVHGVGSRKFLRGIGGKVGKWYGERDQQRDITAHFDGFEVTAYERRSEIEQDQWMRKARAAKAIALAQMAQY